MFSTIELLHKILDTIEEGVLVTTTDGLIVGFNKQAPEILGLSGKLILGQELVHPNWKQVRITNDPMPYEELPSVVTARTGQARKDIVVGLRVSDHYTKWLSFNTQLLEHENIKYVFSTFIDITEKHNLQQEVLKAEERLTYALKGSEIGVWDYSPLTQENYYSEEFKKIIGFKPASGESFEQWVEWIHPLDREIVEKTVTDHLSNKTPKFKLEYRLLTKGGGYKWILSTGKIVARTEDGSPKRFSGTIKDITERKNIENLLKANEEKFRNAFHNSAIGMALVAPEGFWIDVNPALCKMLGYSKTEMSKLTFRDITHPEDLSSNIENSRLLLEGEIDTYKVEKRYFHKNGNVVWALLSVSLMRDGNKPKFFITQIIDITLTKALITQLETKNSQLDLATLDLKNKIEQLEEFNRIVAHNLRGPVGNILQLSDMLEEDKASADLYVSMLKEASTGLDSTLRELIKILEIKLNKNIDFQRCFFDEIIFKVQSMLNVQMQNEKVDFSIKLEVPFIEYPLIYIESILYNLITNAITYKRTHVKCLVKVSTYLENDRVVLEVADNGLGIDLQRYGHQIFKLNKVFHKGYESKGLGLFILKNQIETLGGTISVQSEPEQGSTFKVIF